MAEKDITENHFKLETKATDQTVMEVWYMVYMPHIQIRYLNLTRKTGAQGSARGKIKKRNHSGHLSK